MSLITSSLSVVSLVGVVLIARPTAIFGDVHVPEVPTIGDGVTSAPTDSAEKGTPRDRLIAVGCVSEH